MNRYRLQIGQRIIEIRSPWPIYKANSIYADFLTNKPYDFYINIDINDVESYVEYFQRDTRLPSAYVNIFSAAVLKKVAEGLINYDTFLMHGASVSFERKGFLFTAPSGTGKTTHVKKWVDEKEGTEIINGDKNFISLEGNHPLVTASPWAGKENYYTNTTVPLTAIIMMERAENNSIEEVSFEEAFLFIFQQIYRPDSPILLHKTLALIRSLCSVVKFYRFCFNNYSEDCVDISFNTLTRQ